MGGEKEAEYVKIAQERIEAYRQGKLKISPLGKTVYQLSGQEKVTRIPEEWQVNL
jgi:site-specific DNA-methyltransferase (adenine-specific)/adenine-specific DNA-methyltransferase